MSDAGAAGNAEEPRERAASPRSAASGRMRAPEIPGYRIEGIVARGSSATVYRARQLAVEREVALKVLHEGTQASKRGVRRMQREARTAARLAHPHIVSAIDMGETSGLWWFAMELVDGPSLALRLREAGQLSEREALRLFVPLAEALAHLEDNGVVHRDVKPANILIDGSGPRLADLGLAFAQGDPVMTAQGATLGTPHYISPEQARDPSGVDGRADIWSLGATLFHALCGRPPFVGDSLAEVLSGVLHSPIPDPRDLRPDLSRGLALVLRKCLSRELGLRYQNARELADDLELVRERRAPQINARALEPVHRAPNPVLRGLAVGLVIVAVVVVGTTLTGDGGEPVREELERGVAVEMPEQVRLLTARAQAEPRLLAAALGELESYARTAPEELASAVIGLENELSAELRGEIRGLRREVTTLLDENIAAGNLVGARKLLDVELDGMLRVRTGFTHATLPAELATSSAEWLDARRDEVSAAVVTAIGVLRSSVAGHLERVVAPAVDRDRVAGRWRTAMGRLERPTAELIAEAGASTAGLPPAAVAEGLVEIESRVGVRRDALVDAWTQLDARLVQWIVRRAETLETDVRSRRLEYGADVELREAFERRLEDELLVENEILNPATSGMLLELERRANGLAELADSLLAGELEERFDVLDEVFRASWSERDYETLLAVWGGFARELEALPGNADAPWRARLTRRVDLVVAEGELLSQLLGRAADEVRDRAGDELELTLASIRIRGRVVLDGDPLRDPFGLETRQTTHPVVLRRLESDDLATLSSARFQGSDAEARLLRALLLLRDGDPRRSLEELRSGPLPESGVQGRLADELKDRSVTELEEERGRERERQRAAEELLELIDAGRAGTYELSTVERLLKEYGDLRVVRDRARDLRDLRDRLRAPRARPEEEDYRAAFGPRAIEFDDERARLIFDFTSTPVGVWQPGSWSTVDGRWSSPQEPTNLELGRGPRLGLVQPQASLSAERDLELRIDFELAESAGLVVVSAGGFHVSFAGPDLDVDRRGWLVTSGSLSEHLDLVRRGRVEPSVLLRPEANHRVELELRRRSGRVVLRVDGVPIDTVAVQPPRREDASVEIRGGWGMRLLSVEVEGQRD